MSSPQTTNLEWEEKKWSVSDRPLNLSQAATSNNLATNGSRSRLLHAHVGERLPSAPMLCCRQAKSGASADLSQARVGPRIEAKSE